MKVMQGELFFVPGDINFGLAKVIYCSEYFKDVILIKLYDRSYTSIDDEALTGSDEFKLFYTGKDSIKKGKWHRLGTENVSPDEELLSKRIVASDIWIKDDHIGPASETELSKLPKMRTYGFKLLTKAVNQLP